MKAVRLFIASNGVPYLQMASLGLYSTSGREKEGNTLMLKDCSVAVPPAPVRVHSERSLDPSVTSITSVNE